MNTKKVNTTSTVTVQKHAVNSCIGVKNNKKMCTKVVCTSHRPYACCGFYVKVIWIRSCLFGCAYVGARVWAVVSLAIWCLVTCHCWSETEARSPKGSIVAGCNSQCPWHCRGGEWSCTKCPPGGLRLGWASLDHAGPLPAEVWTTSVTDGCMTSAFFATLKEC